MIRLDNDGERLLGTNYWQTDNAAAGYVYVSVNAGALRVLLPAAVAGWAAEMRGAEYVIATRGLWTPPAERQPSGTLRQQHPREALELLWEDGTDTPFSLTVAAEQVDRMPARRYSGRTDLRCLVYTEGPTLEGGFPARFRTASRLPCLKPWSGR